MKGLARLLIVAVIFALTWGIMNNITAGGLHRTMTQDFRSADPPKADPASVLRVHIQGQIWTCQVIGSEAMDCKLTYSPSARLRS